MTTSDNDDLFVFAEHEQSEADQQSQPWNILLVDDEPDVHATTLFALKNTLIAERPLHFEHAHSATEAKQLLTQHHQFAAAIIDVVMEESDSGLQLVRFIRETLGNLDIRIILRTGQPGYAPEIDTIKRYDINDYKTKSELTKIRLYTSLTLAVRSYAQLQLLHINRRGLEQILNSTRELGKLTGLYAFSAGVVTQLCALLNVEEECLICAAKDRNTSTAYILAAGGHFAPFVGKPLNAIPDGNAKEYLRKSIHERRAFHERGASLFFSGEDKQVFAAYVDLERPLDDVEIGLLDIFCSNIAVAFANVQLNETIRKLAFEDELLQLPNRNALLTEINQPLSRISKLALVDIDDFGSINALLDYDFGDDVLKAVAERLLSAFSSKVKIYRVGADIFALYGPEKSLDIEQISTVFSEPFQIGEHDPLRLTVTSGWLLRTDDSSNANELVKQASSALKHAKQFKRGQTIQYQRRLADAARERIRLLNELRMVFLSGGLHLQYQPFIRLSTGAVVGGEALLRWRKADGTFVPPEHFISLAEQSGFIIPLGNWVIRSALRWRATLQDQVSESFRVAINISHEQFKEQDFQAQLQDAVAEFGVHPQQVELELTESVASENIDLVAERILSLRNVGFSVSIDDFGTGFSSLSVLQKLPVDRLKIDRSFISGATTVKSGLAFAHTVLTLTKQLQLHAIAEGIETEQQRSELHASGCEEGQGYFFSKPLSEKDFLVMLKSRASYHVGD